MILVSWSKGYEFELNVGRLGQTAYFRAKELYEEAVKVYEKSIEINPEYYDAYYNLGTLLGKIAGFKKVEERQQLYEAVFATFRKAEQLVSDHPSLYYNWGNFLLDLIKVDGIENADPKMMEEAMEKLKKGVDLGGSAYNLACLYAILDNKKEAFEYLKTSLENKDIDFEYVETDPDWDQLRSEKEYEELKELYLLKEEDSTIIAE